MTVLAEMSTKSSKLKLANQQESDKLKDVIAAIEHPYQCKIAKKTWPLVVVKMGGAYYTDVIQSELLLEGTHMTVEDLVKTMSKCWQIDRRSVSNDDNDVVESDGHETVLLEYEYRRNIKILCCNCRKNGTLQGIAPTISRSREILQLFQDVTFMR